MQEHFQEKEDEQQSSSDERIRVTCERCATRDPCSAAGLVRSCTPFRAGCPSSFKFNSRLVLCCIQILGLFCSPFPPK